MASSLFVVSEHDQMFDRQTRIWGAHGQQALEQAHVCVLGASATSAECLKNLVLPNVGQFTVIDSAVVSDEDIGNNFFVTADSKGKKRGSVVRTLLLEMNETVKGNYIDRDPVEVIQQDLNMFKQFDLVVASQLDEAPARQLARHLYSIGKPFINLRSYGLIGLARLSVPEMHIVETHFTNDRYDLRLHPDQLQHFPELQAYCDSFPPLDQMEDVDLSHVPYVVILVRLSQKFRSTHDGKLPASYDETQEFKNSIVSTARAYGKQANFQEANQFAYRVYRKYEVDWRVQEVLDSPKCKDLKDDTHIFWVLAEAVNQFIATEGHGHLPVSADIPDMTCNTKAYVRLQNIYKERAQRDLRVVADIANSLTDSLGRARIPSQEIEYFVKNVRGITSLNVRSLDAEYEAKTFNTEDINEAFMEWEDPPENNAFRPKDLHWYFAIRAADAFKADTGRFPGTANSDEADVSRMYELVAAMMSAYGVAVEPEKKCCEEICRLGPYEIHNVAAIVGGIGSQIALKVILRQFIPVNNTVICNGIHGRQTAVTL